MAIPLTELKVLVSGLDHPEGVAYAPDGNVYASGEAGQVYRVHMADQSFSQFGSTGGFGLGIAVDAHSNLYVCDMGVKAVVKVMPDGTTAPYSTGTHELPLTVPNYPVFDGAGRLYVSNSGGWGQQNGLIYRVHPGGDTEIWSQAAAGYTNGMALSPDQRFLYVVESIPALISRIAIQPDGGAGEREVVVELPNTVPDGIAFDAEGNLYIACYAPDRIYRFTAQGVLETLLDDWARISLNAPTNLAFAGPDRRTLVIASLGGYSLAAIDVGVPGLPLHYPLL
ncbi:MAG: SMP-30/gluconolactonase/LRE family protein [Anaerolineae bacterium]